MPEEKPQKIKLTEVPEERRCTYHHADGRRCKKWRWAGRKFCFQHDPKAVKQRREVEEEEEPQGGQLRVLTATEIQERLAGVMEEVREGKLSAGKAYALGYLAQLMLANLGAVEIEYAAATSSGQRFEQMRWRVTALDRGEYWEETDDEVDGEAEKDKHEDKDEVAAGKDQE
jgi:hypothetical protein